MKYLFTLLLFSLCCLAANAQTTPFEVFERNDSLFVKSEGVESYLDLDEVNQRIEETTEAEQQLTQENDLLLTIVSNKRQLQRIAAQKKALQAVRQKATQIKQEE